MDDDPEELFAGAVGWLDVDVAELLANAMELKDDCAAEVGRAVLTVDMKLSSALVYIAGSGALKTRLFIVQHVVFTTWPTSLRPLGQHHELDLRQ